MDKLTHEAIDSRLLEILKETDELFQSGQLTSPFDPTELNTPLLVQTNNQPTHFNENIQNNVVYNDIPQLNHNIYGIQPIKSANGNGHFFSNPINTTSGDVTSANPEANHNTFHFYKVNETKLYDSKLYDNPTQFNHSEHTRQPLNQIKKFEHTPVIDNVPFTKCLTKDLSIVSNWEESQKEVFYNFADKLKQEYQRLQQQLYTQYKLDLEKNINVIRAQYSNTIEDLQKDLINLKAFQQAFVNKEAEYEEKIMKYEGEINAAKQEIEGLYAEVQAKRDHVMALNKKMYEYENAIVELKYGKSALEETIAERNKQLENIEDELSLSLNKSELEHRKNDTLNQNLLETNAIMTATKNELVNSKREIDKLNSEVERLNGIVKMLRETEYTLNQRLSETTNANANLVSKLDNLNLEKSALYSRIDEITSGYEKQISMCNRRINQLEIQMESRMG